MRYPKLRPAALAFFLLLFPLAAGAAKPSVPAKAGAAKVAVGGKASAKAKAKIAKPRSPVVGADTLDAATDAWTRLKSDRKRRQFRQHWLAAIARLEKSGEALAPQQRGAVGYMRAAKAAEELSRLSKRKADARKAIELYLRVVEKCPRSSLSDDAYLAAAALETNRLGDPRAAARHLAAAARVKGDRAAEARRLLASIERDIEPSHVSAPVRPAPVPERSASDGEPVLAAADAEPAPGDGEDPSEPASPASPPKEVIGQARNAKSRALSQKEWSISEQVGLKVRRIVIDAGHGGHDTGAIGPTGVYEKDVTLAISRKLAELLTARGYEAVLTRDSDTFLALEERTSVANRQQGDLFISVHANAHKSRRMSGVETYSLNVASNRYAMRLAARENATTEASVSDLQLLLADFATRANTVDSDRLAALVQSNIVRGVGKEHGKVADHGTKHALFYVLLGTRMPAVLVETAFLSNPEEEKRLASEAYQATVAQAISDGVDQFVARRTQLAALD